MILGHGLWRDLFASDPGIIGRTISLDDKRHVVIGVMRAGFDLPIGGEHEFWLPHPADGPAGARTRPQMFVLGKLARGVSAAEAQRELDATSVQLAREDGALAGWTGKILTVSEVIGERTQRIALPESFEDLAVDRGPVLVRN